MLFVARRQTLGTSFKFPEAFTDHHRTEDYSNTAVLAVVDHMHKQLAAEVPSDSCSIFSFSKSFEEGRHADWKRIEARVENRQILLSVPSFMLDGLRLFCRLSAQSKRQRLRHVFSFF